MRTPVLFFVLLLAACSAPVPASDAGTGGDAGNSFDAGLPDAGTIDADVPDAGTTTLLRVKYPAGTKAMFARGSKAPLNWNTGVPMVKESDDTWTLSLPTLSEDFAWKPLLDDATWSKGPDYQGQLGAVNEIAPHFFRDNGEWTIRWPTFSSALLGNTRGVYVYLPPTYLENAAARMPVVYMHDGQNLFDPAASFGGVTWGVPQTMDSAAGDGRFREAIVVGPNNAGADRIAEYTPTPDPMYPEGGRGDLYLRMLVEELKPRVDAELRTKPGRADTVIIGSSLGGLISAWAGVHQADIHGLVGVMSPSTWWDTMDDGHGNQVGVIVLAVRQSGATRPMRVYVDSGDSGPSNDDVTETANLAAAYRSLGYVDGVTLKYVVQAGATHTESAWASRLPGALEFLLGPGR